MKRRINIQLIIILAIGMIAAALVTAAIFLDADNINFSQTLDKIPYLLIWLILIFALLVCGGFYITKKILNPLNKLLHLIESGDNIQSEEISEYKELSTLLDTIREQHQEIVDNADMRQQFTANVTHELKTPLTAITGYSELIENGMANGEDIIRFAGEIRRNSLRLLTLINDTIRLAELDMVDTNNELELVDLYLVADDCLSMLQFSAESNMIELELNGEHAEIYADKVMMEELVYNLCDNAIRYNVKGGKVSLDLKVDSESVVLSVRDTGIGIPKEHQGRIFERFYRVDKGRSKEKGGTGLGLAIVKHIVARHNAEIYIASEENKGTEIIVIFNKKKSADDLNNEQ